jgi:hypothetical protein
MKSIDDSLARSSARNVTSRRKDFKAADATDHGNYYRVANANFMWQDYLISTVCIGPDETQGTKTM